jgi:hypothetical protein
MALLHPTTLQPLPTTLPAAAPAAYVPPAVTARYAPRKLVSNPNAVITVLVPNPKRPGTMAHAKYACYQNGQTVAQFTAALVALGYPAVKATNNLAWDLQHGFITLA